MCAAYEYERLFDPTVATVSIALHWGRLDYGAISMCSTNENPECRLNGLESGGRCSGAHCNFHSENANWM